MNVEIAQRLAEMRREKGYSQEELAAQLGLSRQAVSKWERAESSPDTGNLIALADLYGVTLDELVRVDADIADDVQFEAGDRNITAEIQAQEAAVRASAAAVQAAAAATQARAAAQAAESSVPQAQQPAVSSAAASTSAGMPTQPPSAPAQQPVVAPPFPSAAAAAPHMPPPPYQAPVAAQSPYQAAPAHDAKPHRKGPWMTFPYPVLCVIVFLLAGFLFGAWHPAWVVYLTIPLYYWIAHIIENDPNYRDSRR